MSHRYAAAIAILLGASPGAGAQLPEKRPIAADTVIALNIPQQSLGSALNAFAEQSGLQVVLYTKAGEGVTSPRLAGNYTARAAMALLLADTQLEAQWLDNHTVAIRSAGERKGASDKDSASTLRVERTAELHLAQAEPPPVRSNSTGAAQPPNVAQSPASPADNAPLEEVMVTAQKRSERLKDVPIAISVLTGAQLDKASSPTVTDILNRVPGVMATPGGLGGTTFIAVRGIGPSSPNNNGSSPIAYYLESVPFGFVKQAILPDPDPYDLERIEVLRGPQGTLYGASAQNGVVRILTAEPDLNSFELKARTSVSSTQGGSESYQGDMAVNAPIVEGKLAARLVAGYAHEGGWIDRSGRPDANDAGLTSFRLKVAARPTENLSISAFGWISRSNYDEPNSGITATTNSSRLDEPLSTAYNAYGVKVEQSFPSFTVTSMTSYINYHNDNQADLNPTGAGTLLSTLFRSNVFSQELNFSSIDKGPWRWSAGAFYRDARDQLAQQLLPASDLDYRDQSESAAVFGQLSRFLAGDRLQASIGLRYFRDEVTDRQTKPDVGQSNPNLYLAQDTFKSTTPRVSLSWFVNDAVTLYTTYSEGFRSGFNQNANVFFQVGTFPPVKPDKLKNYELGAKGSLFGDLLSFDLALYYVNWEKVQQTLLTRLPSGVDTSAVVNGPAASGPGIDGGITLRPLTGLSLNANFSINDITLDRPVIAGATVLFEEGDRLNFSPKYTFGTAVDYEFPLRNGYRGLATVSANYTSEQVQRSLVNNARYINQGDDVLVSRVNFSLLAPKNWTASLFVDNVNNEDGIRVPFSVRPNQSVRVRPRTVGLQLETQF